jgi:WS/DGAT C-terminal domain
VTEQVLDVPIRAVVGGLHLPVHAARTPLVPQAVLGNPHTPWQPISERDAGHVLEQIEACRPRVIALSGHDSTPWTYDAFRRRFGRPLPHPASRRRTATRQRFMNIYIANVPGPPVSLYLAEAPLVEAFPVVPIMGNVPLGIGALSYAGQFNITVVADRDSCPDAGVFTAGLRASLEDLARAAPVPS